jgi:hypothetical protein
MTPAAVAHPAVKSRERTEADEREHEALSEVRKNIAALVPTATANAERILAAAADLAAAIDERYGIENSAIEIAESYRGRGHGRAGIPNISEWMMRVKKSAEGVAFAELPLPLPTDLLPSEDG